MLQGLRAQARRDCGLERAHHDSQEVPDFSGRHVGQGVVLDQAACAAADALEYGVHLHSQQFDAVRTPPEDDSSSSQSREVVECATALLLHDAELLRNLLHIFSNTPPIVL